jgi:hypothetical protein
MDVPTKLKQAADKANLVRVRFAEKNIPTDLSQIVVLPFFGDSHASFVLSTLLLRKFREQSKGSKYFILVSWSGHEAFYPYVDEYWSPENLTSPEARKGAKGFCNTSLMFVNVMRNLNYFFEDVVDPKLFETYYHNGLKREFFDKYKEIEVSQPAVASSISSLGVQVGKQLLDVSGRSVFFNAAKTIRSWQHGVMEETKIPSDFWVHLSKKLIENNITPIVWLNELSYDISKDVTDKCVYFPSEDASKVLTAMRTIGCVLDLFTGISRMAITARSPFVVCDERDRYYETKEYEIDDLCATRIPREYMFSFSAIISRGNKDDWEPNLIMPLIAKLKAFLPSLDRDSWPTLAETKDQVSYNIVRKRKATKLGTKFIQVNRK